MAKELIPTVADIGYLRDCREARVRISPEIAEAAESIQWTRVPLTESSMEEQVAKGTFEINPHLSFREVLDYCLDNYRDTLREASASTAQGALLRAGSQTLANGWYLKWPAQYESYFSLGTSDKFAERFPPRHGSAFPRRASEGVTHRTSRMVGYEIEIVNQKWMGGEDIPNELFEDDQTGQVGLRLQHLGESARAWEEAYAAGRLGGAAFTLGPDSYAASAYTWLNHQGGTGTGPYSANRYATSVGNRPSSFSAAQLNLPNFILAIEALYGALDLHGIKMMVQPDTLVVSSFDVINADVLLQSQYIAGISGLQGLSLTDAGNAGALRGPFSANVARNYVNKKALNIFLPRGAWYVGQSGRGIHWQNRTPLALEQEAPNAGASFDFDETRYRTRKRCESEWIDSSFWYQGYDGGGSTTLRQ
ncbi:MAG TPA: hypothetical protein VNI57_01435 [Candidatus Saccharimonadales bacterium]|nr:hypothetical protein [Candidatus Saccharimonadales bacterium]